MFELYALPEPEEIGELDDAGLIDAMVVTAALESAARECRLAALDELSARRVCGTTSTPPRPQRLETAHRRPSRRRRRKSRKRRLRR